MVAAVVALSVEEELEPSVLSDAAEALVTAALVEATRVLEAARVLVAATVVVEAEDVVELVPLVPVVLEPAYK